MLIGADNKFYQHLSAGLQKQYLEIEGRLSELYEKHVTNNF